MGSIETIMEAHVDLDLIEYTLALIEISGQQWLPPFPLMGQGQRMTKFLPEKGN
jgi:hypothetical protein